ncbi:MAG: hypothetical protein MUP11_05500, partial [Anaerolineales bacterium]|nr:hypothetical protein [Anaerolineales bacterium]
MQHSSDLFSAHETFPLTRGILDRLSLTPEYDYLVSFNARQINARLEPPLQPYTAGEITAIGLIGKIFLHVIDFYRQSTCPAVFEDLDIFLRRELGTNLTDKALDLYLGSFPTTPSYYTPPRAVEYFLSYDSSTRLRHGFYHSIILILSADSNFAIRSKDGFITDPVLRDSSLYRSLKDLFEKYFSLQPGIGESGESLLDLLNA